MGYIDIQVNGYRGINFSDPSLTEAQFLDACEGLSEAQTEVFLPTLVTCPVEVYERNLKLISGAVRLAGIEPQVPGIHLEGPFISPVPGAVGAHNPTWVKEPTVALLNDLVQWSDGSVRMLTLAPEIRGSDAVLKECTRRGIVGALGHSLATNDEIRTAADAGASVFTHLGNGIANMLPRHPNTIWSVLAEDRLAVSLIADGHHLPAEFIKTVLRVKGAMGTVVVSDGTHVSGMNPGVYPGFDGDIVLEENGKLHDPTRGCLAGSSAVMADCVSFLVESGLMDTRSVGICCAANQRKLLGLT